MGGNQVVTQALLWKMFINLDKDFSTYCLSEARPLVYKMKSPDQKLQLKLFTIVIWNYAHELSLAMPTKVTDILFRSAGITKTEKVGFLQQ